MAERGLRRIEALPINGMKAATVAADQAPELLWVAPGDLLVDDTYQRDLSDRSIRLIRRIIEGFSWNRFKPPIVVRTESGALHIIDGQHTSIVCASLRIQAIPVMVVTAADTAERARAFVGHNKDRTPVSPIDILRALQASGDEDAMDVANVCRRAGVRIRHISPGCAIAEGDTAAVGVVRKLVKTRGVRLARKVLETLVKARRAPIAGADIMAAEAILCGDAAMRPDVDTAALARAIEADGIDGIEAARSTARRIGKAQYAVLAGRWLRRLDGES